MSNVTYYVAMGFERDEAGDLSLTSSGSSGIGELKWVRGLRRKTAHGRFAGRLYRVSRFGSLKESSHLARKIVICDEECTRDQECKTSWRAGSHSNRRYGSLEICF
jgi:hypothetical protein